MSYANDLAVAFAMYCDTNGLAREQGLELAEQVGEAIAAAADDRPEGEQ